MKIAQRALLLIALIAMTLAMVSAPRDADARKIRDGQGLFCTWTVVEGSEGTCVAYKMCSGLVRKRLPDPNGNGQPGHTSDGGETCVFNGIVIEDGQLDTQEPEQAEEHVDVASGR